jgi:hypothetical protein
MKNDTVMKKTINWALTAIIFIMVMEICARLDDYIKWGAPFWGDYSEKLLSNTDSLGYRNVPNAKFQKWRIDSLGFRGPEITMAKPPGIVRIMILGASETFGLYESQDKEYPAQMQQALDSLYPDRFQVINAASAGMTMPRVTRYYQDYLHKFDPDIVIYYPTPNAYLAYPPPKPETTAYVPIIRQNHLSSRLLPKISILVKQVVPISIQTAAKKIMINRQVKKHPPNWVFEHPTPERMQLFRDQINTLITTVRQSGAQLMLMTHAIRLHKVLSADDIPYVIAYRKMAPWVGQDCMFEVNESVNDIIRQQAKITGISLIDIDELMPKDGRNFADYGHFTDEGARVMANICTQAVIQFAVHKAFFNPDSTK